MKAFVHRLDLCLKHDLHTRPPGPPQGLGPQTTVWEPAMDPQETLQGPPGVPDPLKCLNYTVNV